MSPMIWNGSSDRIRIPPRAARGSLGSSPAGRHAQRAWVSEHQHRERRERGKGLVRRLSNTSRRPSESTSFSDQLARPLRPYLDARPSSDWKVKRTVQADGLCDRTCMPLTVAARANVTAGPAAGVSDRGLARRSGPGCVTGSRPGSDGRPRSPARPGRQAPSPRNAFLGRSGTRTATHRDHHVRLPYRVSGQQLRLLTGDVDALLGHRLHRHGVDLGGRRRAGGQHVDTASGQLLEVAGGHLRSSCVVHTDEQDGGLVVHGCCLSRLVRAGGAAASVSWSP